MLEAQERADTAQPTGGSGNPYKGPYFLTEADEIYGRDRELAELESLLLSQRVVVLHSMSGVGKTSLLRAGLRRRLEVHAFDEIWVTGFRAAAESEAARWGNRYETAIVKCIEGADPKTRLSEALDARSGHQLLVIDQFEELFTLAPTDWPAKRAFLAELGKVLQKPTRWAILALREEFLAELDSSSHLFPGDLQARMRLEPLTTRAAVESIAMPAEANEVHFDLHLARDIAQMLALVKVSEEEEDDVFLQGDAVEPMHLQLLCHELWKAWRQHHPDAGRLTGSDVARLGFLTGRYEDLDAVFVRYFNSAIGEASGPKMPERRLRSWFERQLITIGGHRAPAQAPPDAPGADVAMDRLEQRYVIRRAPDARRARYELSHDRLITAVRQANRARLEVLGPLYEKAKAWGASAHREEDLETSERALAAMQAVRDRNPGLVSEGERDFLQRSVELIARRRAEEEAAQRRRLWALAGVVVLVVALIGLFVVLRESRDVGLEKTANERAGSALLEWDRDPALALRMAVDAGRAIDDESLPVPPGLRTVLYRFAGQVPTERVLRIGDRIHLATAVGTSPDGRLLATGDHNGVIVVVDVADDGATLLAKLAFGDAQIATLDIAADGRILAVDVTGYATTWERTGDAWVIEAEPERVGAAAFTSDGELVVLDDEGRSVRFEGARGELALERVASGLTAGAENVVVLFGESTTESGEALPAGLLDVGVAGSSLRALQFIPTAAAYSPDGATLVIGGHDGRAALLSGTRFLSFGDNALTSPIRSVAFTSSHEVVLASDDGAVVWELQPRPRLIRVVRHPVQLVRQATFAASATSIVVLTASGTVEWWRTPVGHDGSVTALALGGTSLISGGDDGILRVWDSVTLSSRAVGAKLGSVTHVAAVGTHVAALWSSGTGIAFDTSLHPDGQIDEERAVSFRTASTPASAFALAPTGTVAIGSASGQLAVWEQGVAEAEVIEIYEEPVSGLAWNAAGDQLLVGLQDGRLILRSGDGLREIAATLSPVAPLTSLAWHTDAAERTSPSVADGGVWLVGGADGTVAVLSDAIDVADAALFSVSQAGAVTGVIADPAGDWVVSTSATGQVNLWSWTDEGLEERGVVAGRVPFGWAAAEGDLLYVGDRSGLVHRYPMDDAALLETTDRLTSWLPVSSTICSRLSWLAGCPEVANRAEEAAEVRRALATTGVTAEVAGDEVSEVVAASDEQLAAALEVAERYREALESADWERVRSIGIIRSGATDETLDLAFGDIESSAIAVVSAHVVPDGAVRLRLVYVATRTENEVPTLTASCVLWEVRLRDEGSSEIAEFPEAARVVDRREGEFPQPADVAAELVPACSP